MNEIERLQHEIARRIPDVNMVPGTPPRVRHGPHWLDVRLGERHIVIEWRPGKGFGVSDETPPSEGGYGEGPGEVFRYRAAVLDRVAALLCGAP